MKRVPQLDSVRGLAVLVVLLHNTDKQQFTGYIAQYGWMGFDLFFVLSGFLITGILLETKGSYGYFKKFYARRCLRIWPLYYCALLFMFVVVPHLRPGKVIGGTKAPARPPVPKDKSSAAPHAATQPAKAPEPTAPTPSATPAP